MTWDDMDQYGRSETAEAQLDDPVPVGVPEQSQAASGAPTIAMDWEQLSFQNGLSSERVARTKRCCEQLQVFETLVTKKRGTDANPKRK